MIIYAGLPALDYPHVLVAFSGSARPSKKIAQLEGVSSLFVDSGAYSAWSIGKQLDVRDYAAWARHVVPRFAEVHVASLDVIPGVKGKTPTREQFAEAVHGSLTNGNMLRAAGLKVCEAYHFGEPIEHLHTLIERRQEGELLCLGGLVGRSQPEIIAFCDGVFHELMRQGKKRDGSAVIPPVHAFGLTRFRMMRRYPWYSCDSTTNHAPRRYGQRLTREGTEVWIEKDRPERRQSGELVDYEARRILGMWRKIETDMSETWERRGIRFAP